MEEKIAKEEIEQPLLQKINMKKKEKPHTCNEIEEQYISPKANPKKLNLKAQIRKTDPIFITVNRTESHPSNEKDSMPRMV